MTFILKDENDKTLTGIMGDGMYYSMKFGEIPIDSILFDEEYYNEMLKYEPVVYDENTGEDISINSLRKVFVKI